MKMRGLEPIVAAILLIVVAVIGAVLLYLWFSGFVERGTTQAEQLTGAERLKIETANLTATTRIAIIYVRNMTGAPVTFNTAYLLRPGTSSPICPPTTTVTQTYGGAPGLIRVAVTFPGCSISSGAEYAIKLVTARGTEVVTTVVAS